MQLRIHVPQLDSRARSWRLLAASLALPVALCAAGCHRKHGEAGAAITAPKPPPVVSEVDLKSYKPNEAGAVMVLMYHRISAAEPNGDLNRTPESFRKDLQDLYQRGYRPVNASDFVENKMDVPLGKSPVVLTFDDALPTQFKIITGTDGQPHIDPDCAVGILETFHKEHPDWAQKATFFVLPKEGRNGEPFGQPESVADKYTYLTKNGYEIANHTSTHDSMRGASADKVQWELATAVKDAKAVCPDAQMKIMALPYGQVPRKDSIKYLLDGESDGHKYHNEAVFKAAYRPVASPITYAGKKTAVYQIAPFNVDGLERMTPNPDPKKGQTYEYWLKWLDDNPSQRYVSDGIMDVCYVPKSYASMVDPAALRKEGKILKPYSFAAAAGGLSVETGHFGSAPPATTPGASSSAGSSLSVQSPPTK